MKSATRYHPLIAALHWLLAVLIVAMLVMGFAVLAGMPNSAPAKATALGAHMVTGAVIGVLMLARLVARWRLGVPAPLNHGALQRRLAAFAHGALYLLVFALVGSGIGTAIAAGLPLAVFGGGAWPADFSRLPPRVAHGLFAVALVALLALHLCGVLYHVLRREPVLRRMAVGRSP